MVESTFGDGQEDFKQAEWLSEKMKRQWRYDHSSELWHHYDGVRWAPDKTHQVMRTVALLAAEGISKTDKEAVRKALLKLMSNAPIERALTALATFPDYSTDGTDWDNEPHLLGTKNAIVDLRLNAVVPSNPEQTVTRNTHTAFTPISGWAEAEERAPNFIRVLQEWTADFDKTEDLTMVKFLLDWFGASLFGFMPEQRFLLMTGGGRNGKGALRHAVMQALGPEYSAQPDGNFYSRSKFGPARSNEARADLMAVRGIRVAFFSEPDRGQFNEEMLKAHTGGDMITARGLYQRIPQSWEPTHSINFLVNNAPSLDDVGPSMGSRVMVADFRHRFDGDAEDKNLYRTLTSEKDGILAILVWAAATWFKDWHKGGGLRLPPRVVEQSQAFMERNDPVAECLRDAFREGPDESCAGQAAYDAYRAWHDGAGRTDDWMSMVKFAAELEKKGFRKHKTRAGMRWNGLAPLGAMALAEKAGDEDDE